MMKTELLRDEIFENAISIKLEEARKLAQVVLDQWNALGFEPVKGAPALYELIWNTEVPFNEQKLKLETPAEGIDEKLAAEHAASVKVPYPESLYKSADLARRNAYLARTVGLIDTDSAGKKVKFVTLAKDQVVKSKSVYATNQAQAEYFKELEALVNKLNVLNKETYGSLLVNGSKSLGSCFAPPIRPAEGFNSIGLNPEGCRELLKRIR